MGKNRMLKKSIVLFAGLVGALVSLTGCSTYTQQARGITEAWQAGDIGLAVTNVTKKAEKSVDSKDELIWRLEQGTILSVSGDIQGGLEVFDRAEEIVDRYEEEAKVKVGSETLALFSNQANLPYRGRPYDKIMLNTYKALNYLLLSEPDAARVELNRCLQRQRDAVDENNKRIEEAQAIEEQAREGAMEGEGGEAAPEYDVERARQDYAFASAVDAEMAQVDARMLSYADYVNPFSVFVDGLFHCHLGLDNSDLERARKSFERVKGMSPGRYIAEDCAMADSVARGGASEPVTYVLFATGSAPSRDQVRIDIPLFLVTDEISYIGAAFPKLEYHDDYIEQIFAQAGGASYASENLCSMDAVVSREFKNEWPVILTKTLLTTATKAIVARAAEEVAKQNGNLYAQWGTKLVMAGYQAATNIADLRTWTTLPKNFAYIRMPTPKDGTVELTIGAQKVDVEIVPEKTNILMVRSVNAMSFPIVDAFTLN